MVDKSLTHIAIPWSRMCGPQLTTKRGSSEQCADCHHAKWAKWRVMQVAR